MQYGSPYVDHRPSTAPKLHPNATKWLFGTKIERLVQLCSVYRALDANDTRIQAQGCFCVAARPLVLTMGSCVLAILHTTVKMDLRLLPGGPPGTQNVIFAESGDLRDTVVPGGVGRLKDIVLDVYAPLVMHRTISYRFRTGTCRGKVRSALASCI